MSRLTFFKTAMSVPRAWIHVRTESAPFAGWGSSAPSTETSATRFVTAALSTPGFTTARKTTRAVSPTASESPSMSLVRDPAILLRSTTSSSVALVDIRSVRRKPRTRLGPRFTTSTRYVSVSPAAAVSRLTVLRTARSATRPGTLSRAVAALFPGTVSRTPRKATMLASLMAAPPTLVGPGLAATTIQALSPGSRESVMRRPGIEPAIPFTRLVTDTLAKSPEGKVSSTWMRRAVMRPVLRRTRVKVAESSRYAESGSTRLERTRSTTLLSAATVAVAASSSGLTRTSRGATDETDTWFRSVRPPAPLRITPENSTEAVWPAPRESTTRVSVAAPGDVDRILWASTTRTPWKPSASRTSTSRIARAVAGPRLRTVTVHRSESSSRAVARLKRLVTFRSTVLGWTWIVVDAVLLVATGSLAAAKGAWSAVTVMAAEASAATRATTRSVPDAPVAMSPSVQTPVRASLRPTETDGVRRGRAAGGVNETRTPRARAGPRFVVVTVSSTESPGSTAAALDVRVTPTSACVAIPNWCVARLFPTSGSWMERETISAALETSGSPPSVTWKSRVQVAEPPGAREGMAQDRGLSRIVPALAALRR